MGVPVSLRDKFFKDTEFIYNHGVCDCIKNLEDLYEKDLNLLDFDFNPYIGNLDYASTLKRCADQDIIELIKTIQNERTSN